jgi:hypothetical protein
VKQITSGGFSLRDGHWNGLATLGLVTARFFDGKGRAMGQQLQPWRSGDGEKLWLSMLIATMEEVSRPEFRALPCDRSVLAAVSAQLALPASPYRHSASQFSLRN